MNDSDYDSLPDRPPAFDEQRAVELSRASAAMPGPGVPAWQAADDWAVDWRRVLATIARLKWWILLLGALGAAAGLIAGRRRAATYAAQATIWIDAGSRTGGAATDRGPFRGGQLLDADAWLDLLRSYVVLDDVARRERLFVAASSPQDSALIAGLAVTERYRPGDYRLTLAPSGMYALATGDGIPLEQVRPGDSLGLRLGFLWTPPAGAVPAGHAVSFSLLPLRDAARRLAEQLDAKIDLDGSFLRIELRGGDPARLAAIVNAVADRYVEVAAELKREKLTELTRTLATQLDGAQQGLTAAEAALERFGVRTITEPSAADAAGERQDADGSVPDPAREEFFRASLERDQLARDRAALEQALAQAGDSGLSGTALIGIEAVGHSAELAGALKELTDKEAEARALRYRYAEEYPPLRRLEEDIATLRRRTLPALAGALAEDLAARQRRLDAELASASRDLRGIPPRAIEAARLRRAVTIAENLYTTVEQRYQEARLAESSAVPDVRILDAATAPRTPVTDLARRLLFLGLCGGLALGVAGALVLDRFDPRLRYPEQVSRELGLPILGTVPHLRRRWRGVDVTAAGAALEAIRGIRLNVVRACRGAAPSGSLVFAVSSPGAGDGKSFLASNLALSFALVGHPAVVVDADLRRGRQHRRFEVPRRPGLAEYLRGEVEADAIFRVTAVPGVSLVTSGARTAAAPELLESPRLARLLALLRERFPVVVCDCPPLGAGVDAYVVGAAAGSVLLVLRTGVSHRIVAGTSIEMLRRLPVRLLGAVLNDVPALPAYRYYPYAPDYAVSEEEGEKEEGRVSPPRRTAARLLA